MDGQADKNSTKKPIFEVSENIIQTQLKWKIKLEKLSGFHLDRSLWNQLRKKMFKQTDPSSLALFRILFGITMFLDIPDERGMAYADKRWMDDQCFFPLIHSLKPLPYHWMCILYLIMWLGTIGVTIGYHFHLSSLAFCVPFWYIILLDKTSWNNHTYLFGLTGMLLFFTRANSCWSVDKWKDNTNMIESTVPMWNYVILRYQIFILYFMAGLKKFNFDWLGGYSMISLSNHMVFQPFSLLLTPEQTDYWIVHVTGFLIDSFGGFGLYFNKTRPLTLIYLTLFHLMNSRLFSIGMFPYVGIVTMFIFCGTNWPRKLIRNISNFITSQHSHVANYKEQHLTSSKLEEHELKQNITMCCIFVYIFLQLFMPYSHFITKGYNIWANGLYGYSWDMMVHSWDMAMTQIKIVDNCDKNEYFINPMAFVQNDKWLKHPDMVIQYGNCIKNKLRERNYLGNISMFVSVWCSLNKRFYQRMYDPNVDILTALWSPFAETPWVMPLLTEFTHWRQKLLQIQEQVYSESNYTDVIFISDFPGLYLENYISDEFSEVELKVLEGKVRVEIENNRTDIEAGNCTKIPSKILHKVYTVSQKPSSFMYTYYNKTRMTESIPTNSKTNKNLKTALQNEFWNRCMGMKKSILLVYEAILHILKNIPVPF